MIRENSGEMHSSVFSDAHIRYDLHQMHWAEAGMFSVYQEFYPLLAAGGCILFSLLEA